jgi:hypothetical protein
MNKASTVKTLFFILRKFIKDYSFLLALNLRIKIAFHVYFNFDVFQEWI